MAKSKGHPSEALLVDLAALFQKHKWSGRPVGFVPTPKRTRVNAVAFVAAAADGDGCPKGTSLKTISFQLEDGTIVTKTLCLP